MRPALACLAAALLPLVPPTAGQEDRSIIEEGKVYNSRLNIVVYSLMSGLSVVTVAYAVYLAYRNCRRRRTAGLQLQTESSRDFLCSSTQL